MKLITRYNRVNIVATVAVLLVGSVFYYFILRYILIHQLDNTLKVEEAEILNYVKTNDLLPQASDYRDQHISFVGVDEPFRRNFSNVKLHAQREHEMHFYRELSFPVLVKGSLYKATVTKSEEEVNDLLLLIVAITIGVIILLLLILFMANRFLLGKIWKPFYQMLESIKEFNLSNQRINRVESISVTEFGQLQAAVHAMQSRIIKDYETLKNFSDNASHEMQTPLAVLNAKLDLLIQDPNLNQWQTKQLQSMYDALGRLAKLNQALLLLTKIENKQFTQSGTFRLDVLVQEKMQQLEDLIQAKHLQVQTNIEKSSVTMNNYLIDILLNNIIGNAIRHNLDNGFIGVSVRTGEMVVSNTGPAFHFDEKNIFERFKKGEDSEGIGLGLALVKQICDNYGFVIGYRYHDSQHRVTLGFPNAGGTAD